MPFETREKEKKEKVKQSSVKHAFSFLFFFSKQFFFSQKKEAHPKNFETKDNS
jgi:hypothetical protein